MKDTSCCFLLLLYHIIVKKSISWQRKLDKAEDLFYIAFYILTETQKAPAVAGAFCVV